ncbi:MAG: DUF1634 domain-containing protein [Thermoplasmata archaeon]
MSATRVGTTSSTAVVREDPTFPPDAFALIARLLQIGAALSLVLLVTGLIGYLVQHPAMTLTSVTQNNPIANYVDPIRLAQGLARLAPEAFLVSGIFVLIITTVLRVVAALGYFVRGKERAMAFVTFWVVVMLLLGLLVIGPLVSLAAGG